MSPPVLDPIRGALLRSQPDSRLVALVREGRERAGGRHGRPAVVAFEEIVRRYRAPLVGFAAMIVPADRADDVVQESLISAFRALPSSDAEINLRPWLFRIVRNRALNDVRDTPVQDELTEIDQPGDVAGPAELAERHEELSGLVTRIHALPDAQREAIVARELEGRGHAEIAGELGTSPGGVRQLIYRARGALREAAGLLIPLPLIRFLLGPGGSEGAGAASAAGAGLAAAGGGAAASGGAVKIAAIVAASAAAFGGALAIERGRGGGDRAASAEPSKPAPAGAGHTRPEVQAAGDPSEPSSDDPGPGSGGQSHSGRDGGGGEKGGDGSGGHGPGEDDGSPSSGPGGSGDDGPETDHSGSGDGSGSGSSGSGSSGSGSSGSGSSGSGSGEEGGGEIEIQIEDPPEIGPGEGSGGGSSGGGSDSSGSGSSGTDSDSEGSRDLN